MPANENRLVSRGVARLIVVVVALAACLVISGCAEVNIDANNLKIPGLTAGVPAGFDGSVPGGSIEMDYCGRRVMQKRW
jgi:hypothetical protein